MKETEFDVKIDKETVLKLVDCKKGNPVYEDVARELDEILPRALEKIHPAVLYMTGSLEGISEKYDSDDHEALFVVTSAGGEISSWSSRLFSEGRYMAGMLADAIADDYLFQMEAEVVRIVGDYCRSAGKGVCARLEAPRDIPMTAQKRALEATDAERLAGIHVTDSYMFDPVKTMCQIYILDDDTDRFDVYQSCGSCPNTSCNLRKIYGKA